MKVFNKLCLPLFAVLSGCFLSSTAAHNITRECGTAPPSAELYDAHMKLHKESHQLGARVTTATNTTNATTLATNSTNSQILVNTYFHIVSTKDQQNQVTGYMVQAQFGALVKAYLPSNIVFRLLDITYSVNDSWATDADDASMKTALRRGTYADLNIYYQTNLSSPAYSGSTMLLGYCTLPATWVQPGYPQSYYQQDGCNVIAGSMPGGNIYGYTQGKTTVHEVGHWFGLLHTFQDQTCDPLDAGDMIADTPQQSMPTNGCPAGKDSCLSSPGVDAIHNYMDYSIDACYTNFSTLQNGRMHNMYSMYRNGK